jgi:uncharacterized protein (DUF934 family)
MSAHLLSLRGLVPTVALLSSDDSAQAIVLASDADVTKRADELLACKQISVEFPKFTDGRGYSIAALLRSRLGYTGALRAVGDVLVDQLQFMARSGFDEFALRSDQDPALALRALRSFSLRYQTAAADGDGDTANNLPVISPVLSVSQHT